MDRDIGFTRAAVALSLTALLLGGCQQKPKIEQCWAQDTKQTAGALAQKAALGQLLEMTKSSWPAGKPFGDDERNFITQHFQFSLDSYYTIGADPVVGSYSCGATAKAAFTDADGKRHESREGLIDFNIYQSEGGHVVSIDTSKIPPFLASLNEQMN